MFKKFTIISTCLLLLLTSCAVKEKPQDIKVKVNDTVITVGQFNELFNNYKILYKAKYGNNILNKKVTSVPFSEHLEQMVLEYVILKVIVEEKSKEENIVVLKEEMENSYNDYVNLFDGKDNFEKFLLQNNITDEFLRNTLETELLIEKYLKKIYLQVNDVEFSEKQLKDFYNNNTSIFTQIKTIDLLISSEDKANMIYRELLNGKNLDELIQEHVTDDSEVKCKNLGYVFFKEMPYEFSKIAFNMGIGEISKPIKIGKNYHIIKVIDKKDTFESVNKEFLLKQYKKHEYKSILDNLLKDAKISK